MIEYFTRPVKDFTIDYHNMVTYLSYERRWYLFGSQLLIWHCVFMRRKLFTLYERDMMTHGGLYD